MPDRPPAHLSAPARLFGIRAGELRVVAWSSAYFFFVLAGYYLVKPVRDAMGLTGGMEDLPYLFLITLVVMLAVSPIFSYFVGALPRRIFVPGLYLVLILNLGLFYLLFRVLGDENDINLARIFYVWVSVFNLILLTLFWSLLADIFHVEQSKRLFGLIGAGGSLGGVLGSSLAVTLTRVIDEVSLLPFSMFFLLLACLCVLRLNRVAVVRRGDRRRRSPRRATDLGNADDVIHGSIFAGITHVFRSPYLLGICFYLFSYNFASTFIYFAQNYLVFDALTERSDRAWAFAMIDLLVNVVTVLIQIFLTGRVIKMLGVGLTLALLPLVTIAGFICLGIWPTLGVVVMVQVARRATNYALAKPALKSLFTVVSREDKYKAQHFMSTFVKRYGDIVGATWFDYLTALLGMSLAAVSFIGAPFAAVWLVVAVMLGKKQNALAQLGNKQNRIP